MKRMLNKLDTLLFNVINRRREAVLSAKASSYGNDLLGLMLAAASDGWEEGCVEFNLASVMNNCKLFYFAGQDTVSNTCIFMLLMLAVHPEWQERARQEVLDVVDADEEKFDARVLSQLKVLAMIANETLRTFPSAPTLTRLATKDIHLKTLFIPKGMTIEFATGVVQQDKTFWGEDAAKFNPERFARGVSAACSLQQAFVPFGLGPKMCIGNNFAMMEVKIIVARVLRRFRLSMSPQYKHHPISVLVPRPKFGMPLVFHAL